VFRPRSAGRRHLAPRGDGLRRLRRRLVGRREVGVDDGVPGVHRVAGGERLAVLVGQLRDGRRSRAAALLERVRHTDLRTHSHRSDIGNERVPKITINHTINLFLLNCNQHFGRISNHSSFRVPGTTSANPPQQRSAAE